MLADHFHLESLEAFTTSLVNAGFRPMEGSNLSRWTGPEGQRLYPIMCFGDRRACLHGRWGKSWTSTPSAGGEDPWGMEAKVTWLPATVDSAQDYSPERARAEARGEPGAWSLTTTTSLRATFPPTVPQNGGMKRSPKTLPRGERCCIRVNSRAWYGYSRISVPAADSKRASRAWTLSPRSCSSA